MIVKTYTQSLILFVFKFIYLDFREYSDPITTDVFCSQLYTDSVCTFHDFVHVIWRQVIRVIAGNVLKTALRLLGKHTMNTHPFVVC